MLLSTRESVSVHKILQHVLEVARLELQFVAKADEGFHSVPAIGDIRVAHGRVIANGNDAEAFPVGSFLLCY